MGDITYYAPWGNLAIFYRDFGYSAGLVKLGRLDAGIDVSPSRISELVNGRRHITAATRPMLRKRDTARL